MDEGYSKQSSEHQSTTEQTRIDERLLQVLARKIGKGWQELGRFLGIETAQIDTYDKNYPNDLNEQVFRMLLDWSRGQPNKEVAEDGLKKALKAIGRADVVSILGMLYFKKI